MKISIVQPFIAHYRESFYIKLKKYIDFDVLCAELPEQKDAFKISSEFEVNKLNTISFGGFILLNIFNNKLLKNQVIVLNFSPRWLFGHALLFINFFLRKKIILWTHGVSVQHGFNPRAVRDRIKLGLFNLADGICFYTKNELEVFSKHLDKPKLFYINNTLDVAKINYNHRNLKRTKEEIKEKYKIDSSRVVIYCARFTPDRRVDLLIDLIKEMEDEDVSFVIIGDGIAKPDFSNYDKVFDFGKTYDGDIKSELFKISDFCFQPAWTGLSVIESFAHGVPFITMKKSERIKQGVEYSYIDHGENGFIFESLEDVKQSICNTPDEKICLMEDSCWQKVRNDLTMDQMVKRFYDGILMINDDNASRKD